MHLTKNMHLITNVGVASKDGAQALRPEGSECGSFLSLSNFLLVCIRYLLLLRRFPGHYRLLQYCKFKTIVASA